VTAFISVGGNKEKIDDFCGSGTPRELMSNSAVMSLHFHSTAVSKGSRGFKARYSFVSSNHFTPHPSFKVEIHFRH
jgi:CUB domain